MLRTLLVLSLLAGPSLTARAEDSPEVKTLKARVAELEAKLKLAEMELAAEKAKGANPPAGGKVRRKPLAERLTVGVVVTGSFKEVVKPGGRLGNGKITLTITDRADGKFKADLFIEPKGSDSFTSRIEGILDNDTMRYNTTGLTKVGGTGTLKGDLLELPANYADGRRSNLLFEVK